MFRSSVYFFSSSIIIIVNIIIRGKYTALKYLEFLDHLLPIRREVRKKGRRGGRKEIQRRKGERKKRGKEA